VEEGGDGNPSSLLSKIPTHFIVCLKLILSMVLLKKGGKY
jgi:hypothetical protein